MRILVTGGNGFVGRALVRALVPAHDVTVLDNLRSGDVRFAEKELAEFELRRVDIRSHEQVSSAVAEFVPDVIVHLAAIHYIPECQSDPSLAAATNILGTVNLLEICPPDTRFVFASSASVYRKSEAALNEDNSPLGPNDVYGTTKLHGEDYLRYFAEWRGFPAVAVRLFNVVGPGETSPHILPEIVAQLKAGRRTLRLGNIAPKRDFIHVADAAAGFMATATSGVIEPGVTETVNLGRGEAHSVGDLIELLAEVANEEISVEVDPGRFRRADNPLLLADIKKIKDLFGWTPQLDLKRAATDLWDDPDLPPGLVEKYQK